MKKISIVLGGMVILGLSATASADKPTDTELYHCGCNDAGTGLEMHLQIVNSNAGGHNNHIIDSVTMCTDEDDNDTWWKRTQSDCLETGDLRGDELPDCATVTPNCGASTPAPM